MSWPTVLAVLRKELLETLRDRRTLAWMIVAPACLFPAITIAAQHIALFGRGDGDRPYRVAAAGEAARALEGAAARGARLAVVPAESAGSDAVGGDLAERVRRGDVDAAVSPASAGARVVYDETKSRSRAAARVARAALTEWRDTLVAQRLRRAGDTAALPSALARDSSVAAPRARSAALIGRTFPFILIVVALLGAFFPAIDMTAGERERGTLEPLLAAGAARIDLVAGKFLATAAVGLGAAVVNVVGLLVTLASGALRIGGVAAPWGALVWQVGLLMVAALVPLVALFSALLVGLGMRARSFKEAQSALTPLQLGAMVPALVPAIPGITLGWGWALVPVANVALLFRDLLAGSVAAGPAALTVVSTAAYALAALALAARRFGSESILLDGGAPPARERSRGWARGGTLTPSDAIAFAVGVILLYFYAGAPLQARLGERGLLLSEYGLLALPALLVAARVGTGWRDVLGVRPVAPRALAGAVILWAGALPVVLLLTWLQGLVVPVPRQLVEVLSKMLTARDAAHLAWLLFLAALTPAICEELVFRGVVLQSLRDRWPAARAIVTSALFFGVAHILGGGLVRLLPTTLLGIVLAFAAWSTRSVLPSMLVHFVNNALLLALLANPALRARYGETTTPSAPPLAILVIAPLLIWAGVRLLLPRATEPDGPSLSPNSAAR